MTNNFLSNVITGVAAKRLTAVEADFFKSNQHEFNAPAKLKKLLGEEDRPRIPTRFYWIGENQETIEENAFLSWYDSRRNKPRRSAEYRIYFPDNSVMEKASEGDTVFFAVRPDETMLVVVTPAESTAENQLLWLFGIDRQLDLKVDVKNFDEQSPTTSDFAAQLILSELGLDQKEPEKDHMELLLERFGKFFPTTREFSKFTRETLPEISSLDDPDEALISWMKQEEKLFRSLEKLIVSDRLAEGFLHEGKADVDGFLKFSLSVQNRRKARVGFAFENHLEEIFLNHNISYVRGAQTENKAKPDFLFPSKAAYDDLSYPSNQLNMLGVKSTCKDRWRQVLSEAARITDKHLITLEPGISENQTNEMQAKKLQLVLPKELHSTYQQKQQNWLIGLGEFLSLVKEKT